MSEIAPITCEVAGDIRIAGLEPRPIERLRRALGFPNPLVVQAKRRGVSTNGEPERIEALVEEPDGSVRIPRGATRVLRATLAEEMLRPAYVDRRGTGEAIAVPFNLALDRARYYQRAGIEQIERHLQGTIVIPCAGGKTTLGVGAIGRIARATLVVVHTDDLLDQWVGAVKTMLGIVPGVVTGGQADGLERPVIVATVQTLIRFLDTPEGTDWASRFGMLIVDEAHHAPCDTFQRALNRVPARVRLGLTATPEREDGMTHLMDWSFGDRLLEVEATELFRVGYLVKPEVVFVETSFEFAYKPRPEKPPAGWDTKRSAALQRKVVADPTRNLAIRDLAVRDSLAGEAVLVLSNHKAHCRALGRLIVEGGGTCQVLVSDATKAGKARRKESIQGMRDGTVHCIVATSLADEGLDVKRLSRVILALPQRARSPTMQRIGRLMRPDDGKKPVLYDIIDPLVDTLVSRADERRTVYRKLGLIT